MSKTISGLPIAETLTGDELLPVVQDGNTVQATVQQMVDLVGNTATWGNIEGTLSDQTDLQTALDNKYSTSNPAGYITASALTGYAPLNSPTFTGTVGGITKSMVGLGNVDNTADANKSVNYANTAGSASNSDTVDGYHIQVDGTGTNPNTIYFKTEGGVDPSQAIWGDITGSIVDQTDLYNALVNGTYATGNWNINAESVDGYNIQVDGTGTNPNTIYFKTEGGTISVDWDDVTNTPTTIAGYGITDAVTTSGNQTIGGTKTFSSTITGSITGNADTVDGYNVQVDGTGTNPNTIYFKTEGGTISVDWDDVTNTPTTIAGYGITDAYTETESDARFLGISATAVNSDMVDGYNIQVDGTGTNPNTIYFKTEGGTTSVEWGNISGTLSAQTDLQTALNGKYSTSNPAGYITASDLTPYAPLNNPTFTGTVSGITKAMVGLGNVDNTADAVKSVSYATSSGNADTVDGYNVQVDGTGTNPNTIYFKTEGGSISVEWDDISNTPTTVAGYGITDAVTTSGNQTIGGTKTFSSDVILSGGTANGVLYLTGSKYVTSGSTLVFNGSQLGINVSSPSYSLDVAGTFNIASNGSSNTATINHTSGSGIALNISKGGNNEAIYVNKTSGSGNAVTVVGTVQATSFVGALTGNASTVTNGVYTTGTQTITGNKTFTGSVTMGQSGGGEGGEILWLDPVQGTVCTDIPASGFFRVFQTSGTAKGAYIDLANCAGGVGSLLLHSTNYNSYAPTLTGGGASGSWGISVTGNAGTVTNGVYTTGDQTIGGVKTFTSSVDAPSFRDSANTAYYLDPANTGTSMVVAGNVGIGSDSQPFRLTVANNTFDGMWAGSSSTYSYIGLGGYFSGTAGASQIGYERTTGLITFSGGTRDTPVTRMSINSSGNVGIGTTSPGRRLSIAGGGFAFDDANTSSRSIHWGDGTNYPLVIQGDVPNGFISFNTQASGSAPPERLRIDSAGKVLIGAGATASLGKLVVSEASSGTAVIALESQGSWNSQISATSTGNMIFSNGGTERMRIDASGNVGIGNNNPTFKLDVNGYFRVSNDGGGGVGGLWTMRNTASGATNPDKNFRVNATGSLEIINNAYNSVRFTLTDSGTLFAGEAVQAPIYYDYNNTAFYVNPNDTSNINNLVMNGFIQGRSCADTNVNTANDTGSISIRGSSSTVASMSFHRTGAYAINMGLGTDNVFRIGGWSASSNAFQMDGSGNLTMLNNVTAYSDARLKTDIVKIENALDKVQQLNGYTYTRTDTGSKQTGVIAQEVMKVLPEVVMGSEDTHYSVAYGNMVGLLIESIKEQQGQINELKLTIEQLKGN